MTRLCHSLIWLALALIVEAGPAYAHAALVEAKPADGSLEKTAPREVRLRFNEPVSPVVVHLVDARGVRRRDVHFETRESTIVIHLPRDLPNGSQVVSYRVISSDGHPVGGSIVFAIGTATTATGLTPSGIDWTFAPILWMSRLILYLGLFLGTGGVFLANWIASDGMPPAARRAATAAIPAGVIAAILSVGLQGLDVLGAPLSALLSGSTWLQGVQSSFGLTAAAAILALLCAWGAGKTARLNRSLSLMGLTGAGFALALSGHASVAEPQWLTRPAVFVHGMAAAFWIGALLPLALIVRKWQAASLPVVRRFSTFAVPAVAAMVAAGLVLSAVQIETPSALLTTSYGRVFLAKMAGVILLLALAVLNRQHLTPAMAARRAGSRHLTRSIVAEIFLAVVILGLVTTWRFTPPPRALAAASTVPLTVHIHTALAMAEITLNPGHVGAVRASMKITTGDFGPLNPKEVSLALANPAAGIEPIERRANKSADGTWQVDDLVLPVSGRWTIRVNLLVTDFDKVTLEGEVSIGP